MSRQIVSDHPFTPDEVDYLTARGRLQEIQLNLRDYPPNSPVKDVGPEDSPALQLDQDIFDHVSKLTGDSLKSELLKQGLSVKGDEKTLKVTLAQHLQEARDASTNS